MNAYSAKQIREADRRCIEEVGVPGVVLMENAGRSVFQHISGGPVGVVCGKGNNGGDGFVVARWALLAGMDTRVVLIASPEEVRGDAAVFMRAYENIGGKIIVAPEEADARQSVAGLQHCAVLVDALLGTGTQGEIRGALRAAIEAWPKIFTIAVDLPSGMHADTGNPCGVCVRADVTVTFAFAKLGFLAPQAHSYLGKLIVADIGIPEWCIDDAAWSHRKLTLKHTPVSKA